jgi:ankyrin repeat protein
MNAFGNMPTSTVEQPSSMAIGNHIEIIHSPSPLAIACQRNNSKLAQLLIEYGARSDAPNDFLVTPLHW